MSDQDNKTQTQWQRHRFMILDAGRHMVFTSLLIFNLMLTMVILKIYQRNIDLLREKIKQPVFNRALLKKVTLMTFNIFLGKPL